MSGPKQLNLVHVPAAIDRRPALIARCVGPDDVIEAVNFARQESLPLSVRGSGHNVAGFAVCDDGLVTDLSRMKAITVDPQARTVRTQGGCNWGEVNDALQPHGLAATGGGHGRMSPATTNSSI
jgi:FAD/FMN-containing dehydrogenase